MEKATVTISKEVFFEILISHSKLSQIEYKRNPRYTKKHFSYVVETKMIDELAKRNLLEGFLKYTTNKNKSKYNIWSNAKKLINDIKGYING